MQTQLHLVSRALESANLVDMVNGVDRNFARLQACIGAYHTKFKVWPTYAVLDPLVLWDLARLLDAPAFEQLGGKIELRARPEAFSIGIAVGGPRGVQCYEDVDLERVPDGEPEKVAQWLGISV